MVLISDAPDVCAPYLTDNPTVLQVRSAHESPQNIWMWQQWAQQVSVASRAAWLNLGRPVFGCAEYAMKVRRDGTIIESNQVTFRQFSENPTIPTLETPFMSQLPIFIRYLSDNRVLRVPDSIYIEGTQVVRFTMVFGVRPKDQQHPYSWSGFINDPRWWQQNGLQHYHKLEYDLRFPHGLPGSQS